LVSHPKQVSDQKVLPQTFVMRFLPSKNKRNISLVAILLKKIFLPQNCGNFFLFFYFATKLWQFFVFNIFATKEPHHKSAVYV
jgi:hypothetical protein